MYVAPIPSTLGEVSVGLAPSTITLIAGPNGVGKSALLYQIYRSLGFAAAVYMPGHRQINLNQRFSILLGKIFFSCARTVISRMTSSTDIKAPGRRISLMLF